MRGLRLRRFLEKQSSQPEAKFDEDSDKIIEKFLRFFFRPKTPKKLLRSKSRFSGVIDIVTESYCQLTETVFRGVPSDSLELKFSKPFSLELEKNFRRNTSPFFQLSSEICDFSRTLQAKY